jgi:ABC-type histidine transport system ATPase subunit
MVQQEVDTAMAMGSTVQVEVMQLKRPINVVRATPLSVDDKRAILAALGIRLLRRRVKSALRQLPGTPEPVSIDPGGQQQRAAIAVRWRNGQRPCCSTSLHRAPDPELVGEVLKAMRPLTENGPTMLVVTRLLAAYQTRLCFCIRALSRKRGPRRGFSKPKIRPYQTILVE